MSEHNDDPTLDWETRFQQAHWNTAQDWGELDRTNPFDFSAVICLLRFTSNDLLDAGVSAKQIRRALVSAYFQADLHPSLPRFWFRR